MNKEQLANRIAETAVLHGEFTLRSGRTSTWYIDKYLFSTQPDILAALGSMFAEHIPNSTTLLAGAELGGIPLVTTPHKNLKEHFPQQIAWLLLKMLRQQVVKC
jgi:orotate phosphoribosyltransferase